MSLQGLNICLACRPEPGSIHERWLHTALQQHHGFQAARPHDAPKPSARRRAGGTPFPIRNLYGRIQIAPFSGRAYAYNRHPGPVSGAQPVTGIIGSPQRQLGSFLQAGAFRADHKHFQFTGNSGHNNPAQSEPGQGQTCRASRVGLLDRSRQRAFSSDGKAA